MTMIFNGIDLQKSIDSLANDSRFHVDTRKIGHSAHLQTLVDIYPNGVVHDQSPFLTSIQFGATFLKKSPETNFIYVRRGGPILEQYKPFHFQKNIKHKQEQYHIKDIDFTHAKVSGSIKNGKSIQIIKTEFHHGEQLQISYCLQLDIWIASNGKRSAYFSDYEELNQLQLDEQLKHLSNFWLDYLNHQDQVQNIKKVLSEYTLCGKICKNTIKVEWHCLVRTIPKIGICEDQFQTKLALQKIGLSFIKIKSLCMLNVDDQVHRVLQKTLQSVQGDFCESLDHQYGRSRVFFIVTETQQVIGGYNLLTLEDTLFNKMRQLALANLDQMQTKKQFEEFVIIMGSECMSKPPYPLVYYFKLFENMQQIIRLASLTEDIVNQQFFSILKLALYLSSKQLSFEKYALFFIAHKEILKQINKISFEQYGPVYCNIVIFYSFITLNSSLKMQFIKSMKAQFNSLDLHCQILVSSDECFNTQQLLKMVLANRQQKLRHYLLNESPRIYELNGLLRELQKQNNELIYYKIILVGEQTSRFVDINQNSYPLSIQSIVNAYHQAYNRKKNARKLQQKVIQMREVTKNIESLKNYQLQNWKNVIKCNFYPQRQTQQIFKIITSIIGSELMSVNPYYHLIVKLQKRALITDYNISEIISQVISNSYFAIPTFPKQE